MNIYFARITETAGESIILAKSGSIEEVASGFGNEVTIEAIYRVELGREEAAMLKTLLDIDRVTNRNIVEDLITRIFAAGRNSR